MREQLTERGDKCDANQRSLDIKGLQSDRQLKRHLKRRSDIDWVSIQAILIYCLLTLLAYPAVFWSINPGIMSDSFLGASYFIFCAFICLISIAYILFSCACTGSSASLTQKATSIVLLLLVIENVFMSLDSIDNLEKWIALDFIDTVIHGNSNWAVPLGMSDLAFLIIGISCFTKLSWRRS